MDKQTYLQAMDVPGMNEYVEGCIERIYQLETDAARLRCEKRDLIANGNGKPPALEVEEARLLEQVAREFHGLRSNAEQREARLAQLKSEDPEYLRVSEACARLKQTLEQMDSDIAAYSRRYLAGLQALKLKTAMLRFLAGD